MLRGALLMVALLGAPPALAQEAPLTLGENPATPTLTSQKLQPQLQLGRSNFTLPVIDYRTPDGTWKRSKGIIVGHDISPNATVGIGFFRMAPKNQDSAVQTVGKSRKVSLGLSLRF